MIFHLVDRETWRHAEAAGTYAPESLNREGFIHFSTPQQLQRTAAKWFPGREDLLVVNVDEARLTSELRWEAVPGEVMPFPHLYGPLNLDAVVGVTPLVRDADVGGGA